MRKEKIDYLISIRNKLLDYFKTIDNINYVLFVPNWLYKKKKWITKKKIKKYDLPNHIYWKNNYTLYWFGDDYTKTIYDTNYWFLLSVQDVLGEINIYNLKNK